MPSILDMPTLVEIDKCCGCAACANKCAKKAISMQTNEEGFLYPVVDSTLCVECGLCEKACPGLMPATAEVNDPKVFLVQHKDDRIRYQSTSGGGFTAIAEEVIKRKGVVFGAALTNGFHVKHIAVDSIEGLARFRNSKYVQSEIGDCYKTAKEYLQKGTWLCFSGTPCQINGLYKFLGKEYDNLITVDVVCKSVPSPMVFAKYIEFKQGIEGNLSDVVFRDKKRGFLYCTMAHYKTSDDCKVGNSIYRRGSESDEWLRLFLSGKISRRSCSTCPYQTDHRVGDFSLGDIWETGYASLDDNKGTTLLHVWSEKGKQFLASIEDNIRCEEYPFEKSRGANRNVYTKILPNREQLFSDARVLSGEAFFAKYAPNSLKIRIKQYGRYLIWRLHLHNMIRHVKHLVIHKNTR